MMKNRFEPSTDFHFSIISAVYFYSVSVGQNPYVIVKKLIYDMCELLLSRCHDEFTSKNPLYAYTQYKKGMNAYFQLFNREKRRPDGTHSMDRRWGENKLNINLVDWLEVLSIDDNTFGNWFDYLLYLIFIQTNCHNSENCISDRSVDINKQTERFRIHFMKDTWTERYNETVKHMILFNELGDKNYQITQKLQGAGFIADTDIVPGRMVMMNLRSYLNVSQYSRSDYWLGSRNERLSHWVNNDMKKEKGEPYDETMFISEGIPILNSVKNSGPDPDERMMDLELIDSLTEKQNEEIYDNLWNIVGRLAGL